MTLIYPPIFVKMRLFPFLQTPLFVCRIFPVKATAILNRIRSTWKKLATLYLKDIGNLCTSARMKIDNIFTIVQCRFPLPSALVLKLY
uniref:Uncharacterized protein L09QL n=1 Tax=African swine fever virus TaxID=10497 RepID=Q8V9T0_ASF|nr:putative protein [African swine fever virus]